MLINEHCTSSFIVPESMCSKLKFYCLGTGGSCILNEQKIIQCKCKNLNTVYNPYSGCVGIKY